MQSDQQTDHFKCKKVISCDDIAGRLKTARKALGKTQPAFAFEIGAKLPTIKDYEAGKTMPGGKIIAGCVRAGINANWLLTGEGPMMIGDLRSEEAETGPIDRKALELAIQTAEEIMNMKRATMAPGPKAKLVSAIYRIYSKLPDSERHTDNVIQMFQAVK